ncbi:uncharacterized protein LOC100908513 [Galendromus occidentalis]|uniref:Uncharacterized protein LOC100908513 n=1 Tax=Galendromus occidentalis TaxID=34638 RepID=A0AAJ7L5A9_9ACAR|nr:uncharacterized protein LOC100908513 [Galendromus occidentalis]
MVHMGQCWDFGTTRVAVHSNWETASPEGSGRKLCENVEAGANDGTRAGDKGSSHGNDDDDDAIFSEVQTQAFAPSRNDLRDDPTGPPPTSDKRKPPKLKSAFVTAGGRSTSVSYEALQAARKKLEDISAPPTQSTPTAEIDTGFKSGRGDAVKVSLGALSASKKVLERADDRAGSQPLPEFRVDDPERKPTAPSTSKPIIPSGSSGYRNQSTPVLGFRTARGTAQKVSEKALKQVRLMFREEFSEVPDDDGHIEEPKKETEARVASGFSTARGESMLISTENMDNARKLLEDTDQGKDKRLSGAQSHTDAQSDSRCPVRDISKDRIQDSKTPARRIAGLKRRTPMCQTPLNLLSSPITPLQAPSRSSNSNASKLSASTPSRSIQQEKCLIKKSRLLEGMKETGTGEHTPYRKKLTDLTLIDNACAQADSSRFRDDISGRIVYLDDVKRSFRREIEVQSSNFDSWFANHFEMVVWKLASYSSRVKELAGCLIFENVLDQLEHRWNVELNGQRSPLRMIVERDAPAEATLVLLVKDVQSKYLIVSDGWYSVPCDVDGPLQSLMTKGLLRIGQKLCVCGAQLRGAPNGVDPLQLEDARLSIRYNSTRRARWYAKMGYLKKSLLVPLFSVVLDGGCLPAVRVKISSCSPLMFFEKFSQGGSIVRPEAAERKERKNYCEQIESIQEKIREEVLRELELEQNSKRVTRTRSRLKPSVAKLRTGEEIHSALESSVDPTQLMEELSSSQRRSLESYRRTVEDKFLERLREETSRRFEEMKQRHECPQERIVAPLLKLMVCCSLSNIEVPLTVWRPSEDLRAMLRVGAIVTIYRANVTTCRKFPFGLTTKTNTAFELFEESMEQQRPRKEARLE